MLARDRYDLALVADAVGGAVVLHPHPSYGGDRRNAVVAACFSALPAEGVAAVRFDFASDDLARGAADATDALDLLPAGLPFVVVGYSFGALVAAEVADERVHGWVLVAPPLGVGAGAPPAIAADGRPKLLLVPAHDQFCPPEVAAGATGTWPATTLEAVPSADHFLAGATAAVAARAAGWARAVATG